MTERGTTECPIRVVRSVTIGGTREQTEEARRAVLRYRSDPSPRSRRQAVADIEKDLRARNVIL